MSIERHWELIKETTQHETTFRLYREHDTQMIVQTTRPGFESFPLTISKKDEGWVAYDARGNESKPYDTAVEAFDSWTTNPQRTLRIKTK